MASNNILITDDSSIIRKQMRRLLEDQPYEIHEASDGLEALEKIRQMKESLTVIFCDINMPNMDGIELLKTIREEGIKTPFVILTTETSVVIVNQAKSFGAQGWIVKPVTKQTIDAILKKILSPTGK